jgi:hypothetical protein
MSNPDPVTTWIAEARKDVVSGDAPRSILERLATALDMIEAVRKHARPGSGHCGPRDEYFNGWTTHNEVVEDALRKVVEG